MAWGLPDLPSVGVIATSANWATKVINCLRYLKGLDGDITIEGNIVTSHNVDGVDISGHEARHIPGGADEIDSPLSSGALADLAEGKYWRGNASNRPVEL